MLASFSPEQIKAFLELGHYIVLPFILWGFRWVLKRAREKLRGEIADAADERISLLRGDLMRHIDQKFHDHEECDARLLREIEEIRRAVGQIRHIRP